MSNRQLISTFTYAALLVGLFVLLSGYQSVIIVAAVDSDPRAQSQADYVCDGTDDQVQIQSAISDLIVGGIVRLVAGNYSVGQNDSSGYSILIDRSNLQISFDLGALLTLADDTYATGIEGHVFQFGTGATTQFVNVQVVGPGTIDGNALNNPGTGNRTDNCIFNINMNIDGVRFGDGLRLTNGIGVGINGGGVNSGGAMFPITNAVFEHLRIDNVNEGWRGLRWDGLFVNDLCILDWGKQDGFEPITGVTNLHIQNSFISGGTGSAIDIVLSNVNAVCDDITVMNCTLSSFGSHGVVELGTANGTLTNVRLLGNTILLAGSGAGVQMGANLTGALIANNMIDGINGVGATDGINFVSPADDIEIIGNFIANCGAWGIDGQNDPTNLTVYGNTNCNNVTGEINASAGSGYDAKGNFGQPDCPPPATPCPTDINGDGVTNVLDLIDLLLAFGNACP